MQINKPMITPEIVEYLKTELLKGWDENNIIPHHRSLFQSCIDGLAPDQFAPIMAKEIENLSKGKSPI